jgi:hypothetical protein
MARRALRFAALLGGAGLVCVLGCGGVLMFFGAWQSPHGTRIPLKNGSELYYTSAVPEPTARRLADYLDEKLPDREDVKGTFQLNRPGDGFELRVVVREGKEKDDLTAVVFQGLAIVLSKEVFDGAPVTVHLCDNRLNTVRVLDFLGKPALDAPDVARGQPK